MLTQVAQRELDEAGRGRREQHLATMSRRGDPGGEVNVVADVTLVAQQRLARVNPDPNRIDPGRELSVNTRAAAERPGRAREREEKRVSLSVDLHSALGRARLADHAPVLHRPPRSARAPSS